MLGLDGVVSSIVDHERMTQQHAGRPLDRRPQQDFAALRALPDVAIVAELTRIKGIGVWTAEIYAMCSLGRADVFAPGDLALQVAARQLFELDARPSETALRGMSLAWSPWRAVAARLLWSYYRVRSGKEGVR